MPTTKRDLQALHYLAKRLRDETPGAGEWHDAGITTELAKLEGHNLTITVERVTRHAGDPEARTPAAIGRPFIPAAPVPGVRHPVKAGEDCRRHVGEELGNCRSCAADQKTRTPPTMPAPIAEDVSARVLNLRRNVVPLRPAKTRPEGA